MICHSALAHLDDGRLARAVDPDGARERAKGTHFFGLGKALEALQAEALETEHHPVACLLVWFRFLPKKKKMILPFLEFQFTDSRSTKRDLVAESRHQLCLCMGLRTDVVAVEWSECCHLSTKCQSVTVWRSLSRRHVALPLAQAVTRLSRVLSKPHHAKMGTDTIFPFVREREIDQTCCPIHETKQRGKIKKNRKIDTTFT